MNAYQIAALAEVHSPDSPESPGAEWLVSLYEDALSFIEDEFDEDLISERADSMVPIYTHNRWQVFVDLCAYEEDVDFGMGGRLVMYDLTTLAGVALYEIATRLIRTMAEQHEDEEEE